MRLKVMLLNMHHGRGCDGRWDMERVLHVLRTANADVIGLNEVDRCFSRRSCYLDQAHWLAQRLGMHHLFGKAQTLGPDRQFGNAILSRLPILASQNHLFRSRIAENRSLLEAKLKFHGRAIKVYLSHLPLNPWLHRKQTDFILHRVTQETHPVILMGDWNMRPDSAAWRKLSSHLTDISRARGKKPLLTYPAPHPRWQLDYIFVSPEWRVIQAEVSTPLPQASDHLPLIAKLRLDD
ncbi:endonuclease [Laceyella sacchari]|uniref:Metal-dependent hydrolase, endonuclease/exonuclease/phosphatase family n=1 Tax=Laceyella tengchongensis TaxID=574699 RepID=A0AA45WPU6_9BACL|nr:endonuclease/exonuclease/phosphatase family protein [Laceyella tengchongensis]AUS09903.1 endonuclease [Laceyella sacchari]SMP23025.1 Metal-dependent hydrolase, endonuclease/exonuclease/phosphatase family [Laceyella tengchongensis]